MNASEYMPVVPRFDELEAARLHKYVPIVHPSTVRFEEIMAELIELHRQKGKDYGSDVDPFANVASSVDFGVRPWVAAMVRAMDKVRRIMRYALTGKLSCEGVLDSLKDLAVYVVIAIVLLEREWQQKEAK